MQFLFLVALTFAFTQNSYATFEIVPITKSLAPSGNGATASFTVTNFNNERTPVQITIIPRDPDINGEENIDKKLKAGAESDDQFQVYPSQFILKPKESQTVRVTWVGNPKVTTELSYRMISEELPINLEEPGKVYKKPVGRLVVLGRYIGSLYITPPGSQSDLQLRAVPGEKKGTMALEIENKGNAHQVIRKGKLKIAPANSPAAKETVITIDDTSKLHNQNVLAGKKRKFELPWPSGVPVGPLKASLALDKE